MQDASHELPEDERRREALDAAAEHDPDETPGRALWSRWMAAQRASAGLRPVDADAPVFRNLWAQMNRNARAAWEEIAR